MDYQSVTNKIKNWQRQGEKVVLVTGVFDLLHIEHLRFLHNAKATGDKLIVGIESDTRVRQIKGRERPINNQGIRQEQLEALKVVDFVFTLPPEFSAQSDWEQLMVILKPDFYAVSSHTSYLNNKRSICQKYGVQFKIVHQFNPAYSSSKLHQRLLQSL